MIIGINDDKGIDKMEMSSFRLNESEEIIMDAGDEAASSTDVRLTHEDVFDNIRGEISA